MSGRWDPLVAPINSFEFLIMGGTCENDFDDECELCDVFCYDSRTGKVTKALDILN